MPPESRVRALADHVICPYSCAGDANAPRSTQKVESRDVTAPTVHYGRARSEAKDDIPKFSWFDSPYRKMRNVLMDDLDFYHGVPDHVMRLPLPGPYDNSLYICGSRNEAISTRSSLPRPEMFLPDER
eukprot:GEMP01119661.1.p1 GENE.GEMP01119661.1~~GEMP01119661.1.p1  ORF type:complete len:128 (+),score=17.75 GEMP01119661.1:83-466(+)